MQTTIATGTGTSGAFALALSKFKNSLSSEEIQAFTGSSMEDIRKEACAMQAIQEQKGMLRNMRRVQPLINGLTQFSGVIEVFVQSKPEILAFIWGPIKFLLQIASTYTMTYDKLLNAFEKIGENLSRFQQFEQTFHDVPRMQEVIVMIYEDILKFYQVTLSYFRGKHWRNLFRSMWSTFDDRFGKILSDLDQHKALVDSEATATHIAEARTARQEAQIAEDNARAHRDKQNIIQIRKWLGPVDYDAFLAKLGSPCSKTGHWFIQENDVQAWLNMADKSRRLLWLTGIPGAGKTFLTASFLEHTKSNLGKNVPIAYAFLSDNIRDSTFAMIIRSFIAQLLHHNLQPLTYFDEMRGLRTYPPSSREELQEMFEFLLGDIGVSYLFIDGLDEIDIGEREMVLDTLCYLLTKLENVNIFLSSRDEVDISRSLTKIVGHIRRVDLAGKNQQDIRTYVAEEGKGVFKKFSLDDITRKQIRDILDRVCDKAEGMFLWARLVIYDLKGQYDMEGLEDAARNLPIGLDAAYGRILNRINEKLSDKQRKLAKRVLGWVMCSTRPLGLNELKQAMAIREGDNCTNPRRRIITRLDELCGPVIEFDAEDKIHFVHFTAKEYLTSKYSGHFILDSDAHQDIAITCITYLSFSCFDIDIKDEKVKENVLSGEYCLYLYTERNWIYHVKLAIELGNDEIWTRSFVSLLEKLLKLRLDESLPQTVASLDIPSDSHLFKSLSQWPSVQRILINYHEFNAGEAVSKGTSFDPFTLHISTKRFREHLEEIYDSSSKSNDQAQLQIIHQNYGRNIFKCARVQCLYYAKGFDTSRKRDEHLNTHTRPIPCNVQGCDFASIGFASLGALKTHIDRHHPTNSSKIDTQIRGHSGLSTSRPLVRLDLIEILFDAIKTGNILVVKGVFELGVDLNPDTFNEKGESVLHYTLAAGHKDIFQLLLEKGASADTVNRMTGTTILNSAISQGSMEYVRLLLQWGASVAKVNKYIDNSSPLNEAAKVSPDIVKLLLQSGASANTIDVNGTPALIVAIIYDQRETVQLLLEEGVDVNSKDLAGETALIHATRTSPDIAKLLLENGASANTISSDGSPALIVAIQYSQRETVQLLLENGADVDSRDHAGNAVLIYAVEKSPDIVKLLLENGANANSISSDGVPALLLATIYDQRETVQFLLEKGADVDSKDHAGDAVLIYAVEKSSDIVKLLLENGASADSISSGGSPALIVAIQHDQRETVQLLLEKGADADSKDHTGNAALTHVIGKSSAIANLLLENGANANIRTFSGVTPLTAVLSAYRHSYRTLELLVKGGAEIDIVNNNQSAILLAAQKAKGSSAKELKLLLEYGANINILHDNGQTALHIVAGRKLRRATRALLENGARYDILDQMGKTALTVQPSFGPIMKRIIKSIHASPR